MPGRALSRFPIHLGAMGRADPQPEFSDETWFEAYADRTEGDGPDGRLVTMFSFSESWTTWEMHPNGDEVVLCTSGKMVLHQEHADGTLNAVELAAGDYVVNPSGCWHTADPTGDVTAIFITAGSGTTHRPR